MNDNVILALVPPVAAVFVSPLLLGIINRVKALFAGRKGPSLFQVYFDVIKLLQKGAVYSTTTTWVFRMGPVISLAVLCTLSCVLPLGPFPAFISFHGDIIFFVALLGLVRFFTIIAALDTGSSFEGMGASREAFYAVLIEPVLLLCLFSLGRSADSFQLSSIVSSFPSSDSLAASLLIGLGFFIIVLAENYRIPFDDPNTHLELTMIHEVMVLDQSGPDFAFTQIGSGVKLWMSVLLLSQIILPFPGPSPMVHLLSLIVFMLLLSVLIGVVESVIARLRLLRVPQLLMGATALAALGFLLGKSSPL
ncbi:MAG: NADH-quinone oxidoreductase subunit H [Chitinivibrionales bacterium]|nr:NADH-quinone oxidoreductase subunit H [Chitinivibrionales bacterium]